MNLDTQKFTHDLKSWLERKLNTPAHDESPNQFYLEGLERIENIKITSAISEFVNDNGFESEIPQEQTVVILDRGIYVGFVTYSNFSGQEALRISVRVGERRHWEA